MLLKLMLLLTLFAALSSAKPQLLVTTPVAGSAWYGVAPSTYYPAYLSSPAYAAYTYTPVYGAYATYPYYTYLRR